MKKVSVHILTAAGTLDGHINYLKKTIRGYLELIDRKLRLSNLDVLVSDRPKRVIPDIGLVAYTDSSDQITIFVDSKFRGFPESLYPEFLNTLAHEIHHALRMRTVGYGKTLFEVVVSEGLADHFGREICGKKVRLWNQRVYQSVNVPALTKRAGAVFDSSNFSFNDWFFGSKRHRIPKYAGYAIGYRLVAAYLRKHPSKKPSQLYGTPAREFRSFV